MSDSKRRPVPGTFSSLLLSSILLFAPVPSLRGQAPVRSESSPSAEDARCPEASVSSPREQASVRFQSSLPAEAAKCRAQDETSRLVPIVFVPGTAASELRLTNESKGKTDVLHWLGRPTFKKNAIALGELDALGQDYPGNTIDVAGPLAAVKAPILSEPIPIYNNFLAWARTAFADRFYVAPYDWRKGAGAESSDRLDRVVDKALCETGQKKVILLAHSLGGLVSRDYIVRKGRDKVAALIAVGTPWFGLPKTVRALVWGYNFEAGIVKPSKGTSQLDDLTPGYTSSLCTNDKCKHLERVSFLKMADVRKLARNFPAVYQQLPTEAFMKEYGRAEKGDFKTVLWGRNTWDEMREFYTGANRCLFQQTQRWRDDYLNGKDFGVKHYLIGGIYDPTCRNNGNRDCKIENRMDMQMARPEQLTKSNFSRFTSATIKIGNVFLSLFKYQAHRDPFIALDSDYEWGDGTTPLLSATAGEYVKSDKERVNPGRAIDYLGANTETQAVTLGAKYGHSAMLDDPGVRKLILSDYTAESRRLVIDPILPVDVAEVKSIEVTISAKENGVKNTIRARLFGPNAEMSQSQAFTSNRPIKFEKFEVTDSWLVLPKEKRTSKPGSVRRTLLTTEIPSLTLEVRASHNSGISLQVTSLEVFVNGVLRFEHKLPFNLISGRDRAFSLNVATSEAPR